MKRSIFLAVLLASACATQVKGEHSYMKGMLVQMDTSSCGVAEKGSKTFAGEVLGTDGQHKSTQEVLCQEYVLQTDRITYRIRPKDDKHATLLPIGEMAEFRIDKNKLILRVPELGGKEREYIVLSMMQRMDSSENKPSNGKSSNR
jgi:hypothetical protein